MNKIDFINITKEFGQLVANDNINFSVKENEIHVLLGENGAGKSTLMSILFGLYAPTKGYIKINGKTELIGNPREANKLKIAMLPQHFKLVDNLSVWGNIVLGYENSFFILKKQKAILKITKIMEKYNIHLDLNAKVGSLSVSDKQKVELLKILWNDAEILIFDEPTSILTPNQVESFLKMVLDLKGFGKTILLITHKLAEIKEIGDRCSILRKGKFIKTVDVKKTSSNDLVELMIGKKTKTNLENIAKSEHPYDEVVMQIKNINLPQKTNQKGLNNISFNLKKGEIMGIASIEGNGESELIKIITGLLKPEKGDIFMGKNNITQWSIKKRYFPGIKQFSQRDGVSIANADLVEKTALHSYDRSEKNYFNQFIQFFNFPKKWRNKKEFLSMKGVKESFVSHIPEDRHAEGLILNYSIKKNIMLQDIDQYVGHFGVINYHKVTDHSKKIVEKYDVRGAKNLNIQIKNLSGGNQQKIILGREIERNSKVLVAFNPTRGLDVGAVQNIYEKLVTSRNNGTSVLLYSGELNEIMAISDRIIVLHNGKIVARINKGQLTKKEIGFYMSQGSLPIKAFTKKAVQNV